MESLTEKGQYNWKISDELVKYAEKYFVRAVQEKDLKETVLITNSVKTNLLKTRKLDEYFHELLEEQRRKDDLALEVILLKNLSENTNGLKRYD